MIAAFALAATLSLAGYSPTIPHVPAAEINEYAPYSEVVIQQVILYRWHPQLKRHHVAQWWVAHSEPVITRSGGRYEIYSEGRVFTTDRVHHTRTRVDPELVDRRWISEGDRVPYFVVNQ